MDAALREEVSGLAGFREEVRMGKAERLDGVGVVGAWVAIPARVIWSRWWGRYRGPILIESCDVYGDGDA